MPHPLTVPGPLADRCLVRTGSSDMPRTTRLGRYGGATLPVPDIHELIRDAEPLGDPAPFRFRGSRWRRFDRLPAPPAGFVTIGNAVCSVNPLYAQGMSVAAQQVLVLREQLAVPGPLDPRRFHRAIARVCAPAWEIATRSDLGLPDVDGSRPLPRRVPDAYVRRVQLAAHGNPAVARAFLRVANLVDPPTRLLAPRILAAVLRPGSTRRLPLPAVARGTVAGEASR